MKRSMSRAALAALCMLTTLGHAADDEAVRDDRSRAPQARSEQATPESKQTKRSHARMNELGHCKEKAQGMKGPERGSFMTECLRSDRYEK